MRKIGLALAILTLGLATLGLWTRASAATAPSIDDYGKLPDVEDVSLSPSGARYALIGTIDNQRRIIVFGPNKQILLVAGVGALKVRSLQWAGEDKILIYASATYNLGIDFTVAKHEIMSVSAVDLPTRAVTPLLAHGAAGNGVWGTYGVSQENGRWYAYLGGVTATRALDNSFYFNRPDTDLYKIDLDTGRESLAAHGSSAYDGNRDWLLGADGSVVATLEYLTRSGTWRLRSDRQIIAQGKGEFGGVQLISQGRTPGTIVYDVLDEHGADHWVEIPAAGGQATEILGGDGIGSVYVDGKTKLLIGFSRSATFPQPVFFDPVREARVLSVQRAFPDLNVSVRSWDDDFDHIVAFTDGPKDSGTWWMVDMHTGRAEPIGYSYPDVSPSAVGTVTKISYKAADGLPIEGILTLPPAREARNLPLVVLPHGGPWTRDYVQFDWWAQAFAGRGYAVFQPNFRGSTGYGEAFIAAAKGEWGGKMQTDISDGVAELARQGIIDPKRVCIVGASYGGYAALAGVTVQQGLYRCAVSVAGVSDLRSQLAYFSDKFGASSPGVRFWREDVGEGRELNAISPARLAARADAPILLIHGKDDTVVPFDQSTTMKRALESAGKPVEMVVLEGEDHWLSRQETRVRMLRAAVAFVEKNNPSN